MKVAVLLTIAVIALLIAPALILGGWVTMLCLGALAHIFTAPVLAIGFWPSVLVDLILFLMFGSIR